MKTTQVPLSGYKSFCFKLWKIYFRIYFKFFPRKKKPIYSLELAEKLLIEYISIFNQIERGDKYDDQDERSKMMLYVLDRCEWKHLKPKDIIALNKRVKYFLELVLHNPPMGY